MRHIKYDEKTLEERRKLSYEDFKEKNDRFYESLREQGVPDEVIAKKKMMQDLKDTFTFLINHKKDFKLASVNGHYKLKSKFVGNTDTYSKDEYQYSDMNFIKKIKSHVKKNKIHLDSKFADNQVMPSDVKYVAVNVVPENARYEHCGEVDINEAYWITAYKLGIIDKAIYDEGKKTNGLAKGIRVASLGALAKKEVVYTYEKGELVGQEDKQSPLFQNLWFTICKHIGDVMTEVANVLGDDFLFYWVDGVYFKNPSKNKDIVQNIFAKHGYGSDYLNVPLVEYNEQGFNVRKKLDNGSMEIKKFTFPNYHKKNREHKLFNSSSFSMKELRKVAEEIMDEGKDVVEELDKEFEGMD